MLAMSYTIIVNIHCYRACWKYWRI